MLFGESGVGDGQGLGLQEVRPLSITGYHDHQYTTQLTPSIRTDCRCLNLRPVDFSGSRRNAFKRMNNKKNNIIANCIKTIRAMISIFPDYLFL